MWTMLLGFVTNISSKVWLWLGVAFGVLMVLFQVKKAGQHEEQVKNLEKAVRDAEVRVEVDNKVAAMPDLDFRTRMREQRNGFQ